MGLITQIPKIDNTNRDDGRTLVYDENEDILKYEDFPVTMRGVAVFVSATEPVDKEINDIWIQF